MKNATLGGESGAVVLSRTDAPESTPAFHKLQAVSQAFAHGLRLLSHPVQFSDIARHRLDVRQRVWGATGFLLSLPEDEAWAVLEAFQNELVVARDGPLEAERQRQANLWGRFCAQQRPRMPRLTKAEQRRADAINFDDTPRERLAAAWNQASEQDRRDLIRQAMEVTA